MSRFEGGLHSLKANPSAGTDDQNSRHAVNALVGPATHRHVRSGRPHRKMDGRLGHGRRSADRSTEFAEIRVILPRAAALLPERCVCRLVSVGFLTYTLLFFSRNPISIYQHIRF